MLTNFRFKNWVRQLEKNGQLKDRSTQLDWLNLPAVPRTCLVSLPDDPRHIRIVSHYLSQCFAGQKPAPLTVLVPDHFEELIPGMSSFRTVIPVNTDKKQKFPVEESDLPDISAGFDLCIDLNPGIFIRSHYITATRAELASLGLSNPFTDRLFHFTYRMPDKRGYDKAFKYLLRMAGISR